LRIAGYGLNNGGTAIVRHRVAIPIQSAGRCRIADPPSEIRNPKSSSMFLSEPPSTQADLHFRLFGVPVRVHPFFWLVALFLGLGGRGPSDPRDVLIWVAVVFVSILVHEMGHAITQQFFGGHPWITLYSFGGLASCNDCDRRPSSQIFISLAGPVAGFFLAAFVVSVLIASRHFDGFILYWIPVRWVEFGTVADRVVRDLLRVNILWGLVNLLPIYPLDGGQISRQMFQLWNSRTGTLRSLQLSAGAAVLVTAYAALSSDFYIALMFGVLAYGNFQAIQFYRNHWR
jgi:stage IV sporulation protein FB